MPAISFNSVLIIAGIAVLVPVVLGLMPRLPVPGAVLEVIAGIVVGPSVLGWVRVDAPVQVLSDLGLGMLLFLAGLEIDVDRLREPLARLAGMAFAVSAGLGLLTTLIFWLAGQATQPLLLATIFMSTSAGLLLPLLKDAGEGTTEFGQLVMTAAAIAEIVPIMLLSLFFSAASKTTEDHGRLAGCRRAAHGRPVPRGGSARAIPGHAGPIGPHRQGFGLSSCGKEHCDPG